MQLEGARRGAMRRMSSESLNGTLVAGFLSRCRPCWSLQCALTRSKYTRIVLKSKRARLSRRSGQWNQEPSRTLKRVSQDHEEGEDLGFVKCSRPQASMRGDESEQMGSDVTIKKKEINENMSDAFH